MDYAQAEFDAKDRESLAEALRETEAAETTARAADAAAQTEVETDPPAVAAPAEAPAAAPAEAPAAAPAAAPAVADPAALAAAAAAAATANADAQGSTKAALRASRHAEKVLREQNAALLRKIEEAGIAAAPAAPKEPDASQLDDVREYAPDVGAAFDRLKAENAELKKRTVAAPLPEPAFVPEYMPDDVQAAIDEVPELLLWQTNAEHQNLWQTAKAADALLSRSAEWAGRGPEAMPLRFAAAVAEVKARSAAPSKASTAKTLEDAQRVIAAATAAPAAVLAVGDLRGGATPATSLGPDFAAMVKAGVSDESIIASLKALP